MKFRNIPIRKRLKVICVVISCEYIRFNTKYDSKGSLQPNLKTNNVGGTIMSLFDNDFAAVLFSSEVPDMTRLN